MCVFKKYLIDSYSIFLYSTFQRLVLNYIFLWSIITVFVHLLAHYVKRIVYIFQMVANNTITVLFFKVLVLYF